MVKKLVGTVLNDHGKCTPLLMDCLDMERGPFSMAVENVPPSFHVSTTFKQIVLFIGYYLLLFIDPLVIICATSTAPCCCYVVCIERGSVLNGRGQCTPLLPWAYYPE